MSSATDELRSWPLFSHLTEAQLRELANPVPPCTPSGATGPAYEVPEGIIGIDDPGGKFMRPASLKEIAGLPDPESRAIAIRANGLKPTTAEARAVIEETVASLEDPSTSKLELMARLENHAEARSTPIKSRKKRRRGYKRQLVSLFMLFRDTSGYNND